MISNIELKSTNFDDENFSPVFNRATQEYFLQPSQKLMNDYYKMIRPMQALGFESYIDKYEKSVPNHTFFRTWSIEKFLGSFGLGYLVLRELPVRNFYGRCLIMWCFLAKYLDHAKTILPQFVSPANITAADDKYKYWDISCYDQAMRMTRVIEIPSVMNRLRESKTWYASQPGHLKRSDHLWGPSLLAGAFRNKRQVSWDGTNNQPIYRLADPLHKDSFMIVFI